MRMKGNSSLMKEGPTAARQRSWVAGSRSPRAFFLRLILNMPSCTEGVQAPTGEGWSQVSMHRPFPGPSRAPPCTPRRWHFWPLLTHSHRTSQETRPVVPELPRHLESLLPQSLRSGRTLFRFSGSEWSESAFIRSPVLLTLLACRPHLRTSAFKKPPVSHSRMKGWA